MNNEETAALNSEASSFVLRCEDLDPLEEAVDGLPLETTRLSTGPGQVGLLGVQFQDMSMVVGSFEFAVLTRGECLPGFHTLTLPLTPSDGSWNGVALDQAALWSYAPGTEHEGKAANPPSWAAISVPSQHWPELSAESVQVRRSERVIALADVISAAACRVELGHLPEELYAVVEADLEEALTAIVADSPGERALPRSSAKITRDCIQLASELGHAPRVSELAESLGISDRWIRAAFNKEFGVSPSSFFRARNLQHANRTLKSSDEQATSVTEVAMSLGFWHLGRFSAAYREAFGELPSHTLARRS